MGPGRRGSVAGGRLAAGGALASSVSEAAANFSAPGGGTAGGGDDGDTSGAEPTSASRLRQLNDAVLAVFQLMALERTLDAASFYGLHLFGLAQLLVMPLSPAPTMPWRPGSVPVAARMGGGVDVVAAFHSFLLNGASERRAARAAPCVSRQRSQPRAPALLPAHRWHFPSLLPHPYL